MKGKKSEHVSFFFFFLSPKGWCVVTHDGTSVKRGVLRRETRVCSGCVGEREGGCGLESGGTSPRPCGIGVEGDAEKNVPKYEKEKKSRGNKWVPNTREQRKERCG